MKLIIGIASLLILSMTSIAQKRASQIEINPYFRWDWYPKFIYSINSVNSNTVKIIGKSFGINASYKISLKNRFYLKTGIGYYKYSFNKIDQNNSLFGKSNERVIEDYIPPGNITPSLIFSTSKYWYNSIAVNIGIEKHVELKKNIKIVLGSDISSYFTFSQIYHITYPYPNGDKYKPSKGRFFGNAAKINVGIQKQFKEITLGPTIILPVYDNWKQDKVFPQENNSKSRSKWWAGIGIGMSCNYLINKKQKK